MRVSATDWEREVRNLEMFFRWKQAVFGYVFRNRGRSLELHYDFFTSTTEDTINPRMAKLRWGTLHSVAGELQIYHG